MREFYPQLTNLASLLPRIVALVLLVVCATSLSWLALKIYNFVRLLRQKVAYIEITPPTQTDRTPQATQQLFAVLHGLGITRRLIDRFLLRKNVFALEIVSTRKDGIRFIMRVSQNQAASIEQAIIAYVSDVKVSRVNDYLPDYINKKNRVIEFKQSEHFAYPLQGLEALESHDPISYITSAMTKLSPSELMSLQLVVTPVRLREADELRNKILNNEDLLPKLGHPKNHLPVITNGINTALFGIVDAIGDGYHGVSKNQHYGSQKDLEYEKQVAKRIKPVRTLSYFEHELVESIHNKLSQPLFRVDIRVLLACDSKQELRSRKRSIQSAFSLFSVPKYQGFKMRRARYGLLKRKQQLAFMHRLPSLMRSPNTLAASELSSLYHFPHSVTAKTENVVKSLSRTLPAPVSLKNGSTLDILLGQNKHHGSVTSIGLTAAERERHVYIIGGTGNGKTTMLLYGIIQDIKSGKGVAVLDPHGDLAETILHHIPENRIKDVIYINPDDLTHPIGVNLLELAPGLSGDDLLREKDIITESAISVMRKIFSDDDSGGHRIEYVLRNAIQTALTLEAPTLFTIFELLNDAKFRRSVVRELKDEHLKNFWKNELGKAGEFQRVKMAAGITAKIGRFLFSASAKRVLEQEKSTIDFDDILTGKKILICNFSKGLLGEDTSTLFGTTMLAKLQVASLRRARLQQVERTPYYLYVDEFQNFATISFVQMLSEARKYKLFLTMAEQSTSQQDQQRLVDIILANVGTVVCFRSGSPADERYMLPLFQPYIEQGEIANLPAYNFYARIAAVQAQEPMSGMTLLLENTGSNEMARRVVASSQELYTKKPETPKFVELVKKDPPKSEIQPRQRKKTQATKKGFNELDASPEVA